jgi:SET domain-containing protein
MRKKYFQAPWQHRWITPKAEAQKSRIHGLGTVAIEQIHKGEIVGVLGGVIISSEEIAEYRRRMGHVGIQVNENFFICPTSRKELEETEVFNHSCEPNIGYIDSITFVAIKDIKPMEELVFDYAFSETFFEPFECKCGSANCRKIIKPDDWKIAKIQEKYGQYFSPYLKKKINLCSE